MLKDIVEKPIPMKQYFSNEATSLLTNLLERDPSRRIGSVQDAEEIMMHPFFEDVNWNLVK